mgnify:CR=1 FL=1
MLRARADVTGPIVSCFDGVKLPCLLATMIEGSALMSPPARSYEPALEALLQKLSPVDLVLIEGYKRDRHPKVEAFRADAARREAA